MKIREPSYHNVNVFCRALTMILKVNPVRKSKKFYGTLRKSKECQNSIKTLGRNSMENPSNSKELLKAHNK